MLNKSNKNISDIVEEGYCIGCGACASLPDSPFEMQQDSYGQYFPKKKQSLSVDVAAATERKMAVTSVCPFSDDAQNEDSIGKELYGKTCGYNQYTGYMLATYVGHVQGEIDRNRSSSGGLTTWLLTELLRNNLIDGVIHVTHADGDNLFTYGSSFSVDGIKKAAKSKYYAVEYSQAIKFMMQNKGRYAFVGIPCFVKSIRLLAKQVPEINHSITYCIAIFCGHLKTKAFAENLAWQHGIQPDKLKNFDFRTKLKNKNADRYAITATNTESKKITVAMRYMLATGDWGMGFFKPNACDYCDDIAGETADITFGDAWLPEYVKDPGGTNIVIVRKHELNNILQNAAQKNTIGLDAIKPARVYDSQAGNYRHKNEGLAYRLWLKKNKKEWVPKKRVKPEHKHLSNKQKTLYELRLVLAKKSHASFLKAKEVGCLSVFEKEMSPYIKQYYQLSGRYWKFIIRAALIRMLQKIRTGSKIISSFLQNQAKI